jgi:ribosomal-protein-alanine N-acetyltransferase
MNTEIEFDFGDFTLRPFRVTDAESLAHYANNKLIAGNLRDAFPYPYTINDAVQWIEITSKSMNSLLLALVINDEVVGSVGVFPQSDVYRLSAEIGYWLAPYYWNRGYMALAIKSIVDYVFSNSDIVRIYAGVFEHNAASARVLTKCGFIHEATHHNAVIKDSVIMNELIYSLLRPVLQ